MSGHEELRELLPWYAAGTLEAAEAAAVEAALAESLTLRRELQELRALQAATLAPRGDEPALPPALIAGAWQRIDAYESELRAAGRTRTRTPLRGLRALLGGLTLPAQWLLASQFAVILALAGVLAVTIHRDRDYRVASGPTTLELDGPRLSVAFQPGASIAEVRGLLERNDGQIVAGPTAEGIYTVALPRGDESAVERALADMRGAVRIVRFAQREQP